MSNSFEEHKSKKKTFRLTFKSLEGLQKSILDSSKSNKSLIQDDNPEELVKVDEKVGQTDQVEF